jgi:hypothetical protein
MIRFAGYFHVLSAVALGMAVAACGESSHNDPFMPSDGGPRSDGAVGGDPDAMAGNLPDAHVDDMGPTIAIASPLAPAPGDYASESILVSPRFVVTCEVGRNPASDTPIDSSSVVITAVGAGASVTTAGTPSGAADQYTATLDVSNFPNGAIEVRCSASDLADTPRTNTASIGTFLDLGPRIDIFSPVADQSYGQQLDITFTVTERPVASDDTGGTVDTVVVTVAGIEVAVTATGGGSYFGTVLFDAPEFVPSLAGPIEIQVRASNLRAATAVTKLATRSFIADNDGPVIGVTQPAPGVVIGGFMQIAASVSDTAGIETVVARIAHQFEVILTQQGAGTFVGQFDTRLLPAIFVFPLVEVVALDKVGNETGVGRIVTVDNRPPLVTLDSPPMRDFSINKNGCSEAYDPLGSDVPNDGETVGQLFELRARIEDQGNGPLTPPEGVVIPHSGLNDAKISLFVLDDSDGVLMVDLDGDSICDDINPLIKPTSVPSASNEAAVTTMVPIGGTGQAFYPDDIGDVGNDATIDDGFCIPGSPPDVDTPLPLCVSTPSILVPTDSFGDETIYTIAPITLDSCMGNAFDAPASHISDGWACLAVRTEDLLGNVRVSSPLRLCIDHDGDGLDAQGNSLEGFGCAPTIGEIGDPSQAACTDGCTPAQTFADFPTRQVRVID